MPLELEIRCADATKPDADSESLCHQFREALESAGTSEIEVITLVCDDLSHNGGLLTALCGAIQNFPDLQMLKIRLSSAHTRELPKAFAKLQQCCARRGCSFQVDFLLDSRIDIFGYLAGRPNSVLDHVNLSREIKEVGAVVRWLIPAIQSVVFRIEGIVSLARDEGIEPMLLPMEFIDRTASSLSQLSADEKLYLWDFITYRFLGSELELLNPGQRTYYEALLGIIDDPESMSEQTSISVLTFSARNAWTASTEKVTGARLRSLALGTNINIDDRIGRLQRYASLAQEVGEVVVDGARGHLLRAAVGGNESQNKKLLSSGHFKKAVLIGAYGGEHIGDIAILGGVLFRIHKQFGIREAVLMTQRPNHTRHLIAMLDVPVDLSIDVYERAQIKSNVEKADCVVFAGGPLIDLPKQLVRHLYTVSLARKMGKPFIAEGIGPGPFVRFPSRFTARQLLRMASQISLRSSDAVGHEVVQGLEYEVGHCPAFDYLQTRSSPLTRLPKSDGEDIDRLLENTEGRTIIGVNIRPIGHMYTVGATGTDVAAYTRSVEREFEKQFAEGIRKYSDTLETKPCFIFIPMNAIQFGQCDLQSAYRIQQILEPNVDFRTWEADASLDGVVALMRRIDIAITMRFHATIFALSQNCKVIGIDYRVGKKDKIAGLMDDVGQSENCTRIDLLTSGWLASRLEDLSGD